MEVATLMTRMHENLSEIHKTIAELSIETYDSKFEELEQKRDSALESLQAKFEKEQEEASIKRGVEIQEVRERRRKEDEEREARRKQEDEERETRNRADDEQKLNLLHDQMRNVEDDTEEQLDHVEAEARQLIEEGRGKIQLLEEKRREINQLIDEQLKLPLPDVPIRKRDRATRGLKGIMPTIPVPISVEHGQERSEDENLQNEATTKDLNIDHAQEEMQAEICQIESDKSDLSNMTSGSQHTRSISDHTSSSLQSENESSLADDGTENTRGEYTSPTLDQDLAHTAEPEEPLVTENYREVEPSNGTALIEPSTKVELDSPSAEPGESDDHLVLSRSDPSSPLGASDAEEANINSLREDGTSMSEDQMTETIHTGTLPGDKVNLPDGQSADVPDDPKLSSPYHQAESPGRQAHAHSDRSQTSQDAVDVLVPNEQRSRMDQMEQSNSPDLVEGNQPFTVLRSPPTSPTVVEKPENRTSIGADRDDTKESVVWGAESLPPSTSHVTGVEDGGSVAEQASHDDHESKVSEELSAATSLGRLASPTEEDPYHDHAINPDSLPRENAFSPPTDQHHTLESNSPTTHNVSDTHSPHLDVLDIKLDEQPEVAQSAEENQADNYRSDQPAGDVHSPTSEPDPELDSNNLESSSRLGQIGDLPAREHMDTYVKDDNLHSNEQEDIETPRSIHVDAEDISLNDDAYESATEVSRGEAIDHYERFHGQTDAGSPANDSFVGEDLPQFEGHDLEGNNNNNQNDDDQISTPEIESHVKLHETPMPHPPIEGNDQTHHSSPHSVYEETTPIINEKSLSPTFEKPGEERSYVQQELGQNNGNALETSMESYESSTHERITNIPGVKTDEYAHDGLQVDTPPQQASRSPLPVENDTMHGHDNLFDDDVASSGSYEDEYLDPGSDTDQVFEKSIEYAANELPDTPRTAVPPSNEHYLDEQVQYTGANYPNDEVPIEHSINLQNNGGVLPSSEEQTRYGENLEIQNEGEPRTPTALVVQDRKYADSTDKSINDSLLPSKGLAASRHAPESQLQTPSHDQSWQREEDFDSPAFAPRDVTNLPWHERTDSTTLSMHSESTLSSAPSSPVHSSPPMHYQEPVIRESWSTHNESRGRLRNDSQLTDPSASDEFDAFQLDTNKSTAPSSIDLDAQKLPSNRNSMGGSPMFQKLRGLFESTNTTGNDQASLGSSRPTSAIYTGAAKPQSPLGEGEQDPNGHYVNEDEDGVGEHTALLRGPGVGTRET